MRNYFILFFLSVAGTTLGQSVTELYRLGDVAAGGSARGLGTAGAFSAIGADLTAISMNPAAIGLYRYSEIGISLNIVGVNSRSTINGETFPENGEADAQIGNLNMVFASKKAGKAGRKWRNWQIGLGYNRTANFLSERSIQRPQTNSSALEGMANELNGTFPENISYGAQSFATVLTYDTYLLNPTPSDNSQYSYLTDGLSLRQTYTINTRGGINEISLSGGANFNDRIYIGATLGIPIVNSRSTSFLSESNRISDDSSTQFNSFELREDVFSQGAGINFKAGLIYRLHDFVRIGLSVHSPTLIGLEDRYSSEIYTDLDTVDYLISSPEGIFNYRAITPFRAVAGIGVLFKQYGFLAIDYQMADYGLSKYQFDSPFNEQETALNESVENTLGVSHTISAGIELAYKIGRLRGGYSYTSNSGGDLNSNPYGDKKTFSVGVGIRVKRFFLDLAYNNTQSNETAYELNNQAIDDKITRHIVSIGLGLKF